MNTDAVRLMIIFAGLLTIFMGAVAVGVFFAFDGPLIVCLVGVLFVIVGAAFSGYGIFAKHVEVDVSVNGRVTHYESDREEKKEEEEDVSEWGEHRLSFQEK